MSSTIKKSKIVFLLSVLFFFFLFLNDNTIYSMYFRNISSSFLVLSVVFLILLFFVSRKILFVKRFFIFVSIWLLSIFLCCCLTGLNNFVFVRLSYWSVILLVICILKASDIDYVEVLFLVTKIYCIWGLICYLYTLLNLSFLPTTNVSTSLLFCSFSVMNKASSADCFLNCFCSAS